MVVVVVVVVVDPVRVLAPSQGRITTKISEQGQFLHAEVSDDLFCGISLFTAMLRVERVNIDLMRNSTDQGHIMVVPLHASRRLITLYKQVT
jgi:hypothetical protein